MTSPTGRPLRSAAAGVAIAAGSWLALRSPAVQRADVAAGDALRLRGSPGLDRVVVATTDLGSLYAVSAAAATLAAAGRRAAAADVAAAGGLAWLVSQSMKTRVRRVRPYDAERTRRLIGAPTGSSFPSGHAAVATAVAAVLDSRVGRGQRLLMGPYVAVTRVYAGVHYPTDVLGGVGLGLALAGLWRGLLAGASRGPGRRDGARPRCPRFTAAAAGSCPRASAWSPAACRRSRRAAGRRARRDG